MTGTASKVLLSRNLRERRLSRGLSQAALSKLIGISQARIHRMESGALHNITLDTLDMLAKGLGCAPQNLVEDEEHIPSPSTKKRSS